MCSQGYNHLPARSDAGITSPTRVERSVRTSVSNLVRMCSQGYNHLPARGDAGTNPSHQRCCAASASHSGETQGDASPPHIHTTPAPTRVERAVRTSVSNLEETSMYHNITG